MRNASWSLVFLTRSWNVSHLKKCGRVSALILNKSSKAPSRRFSYVASEIAEDSLVASVRFASCAARKGEKNMTDTTVAAKGYVHPEVLVSTQWVADHLTD